MEQTISIAFRVSKQEADMLREKAQDRQEKTGTFIRKIIPFIAAHDYLLDVSENFLEAFEKIAHNRKILASLEGKHLSPEELAKAGVQLDTYTSIRTEGKQKIVVCGDMELHYDKGLFIIQKQ